jgi:hypothetical protein
VLLGQQLRNCGYGTTFVTFVAVRFDAELLFDAELMFDAELLLKAELMLDAELLLEAELMLDAELMPTASSSDSNTNDCSMRGALGLGQKTHSSKQGGS